MSPAPRPKLRHSLAFSALAASFACAFSVHAGEVSHVDLTTGATGTRAEIQLQGRGEFKTLSLHGPERLVVDLPASSAKRGLKLPTGQGVVSSVRTGQPAPGTLRIVFDLAGAITPLKPRIEPTAQGARIVIEWPGDGPSAGSAANAAVATAPAANTPASTPAKDPAPASTADAARATAALTAQVVQQSSVSPQATTTSVPATTGAVAASSQSASSPQAILNGQATAYEAPTASSGVASAAPAAGVTASGVPYTVATGQPATPATANSSASPASTAAAEAPAPRVGMRSGMRPLIVAIDPGHGGQDSGAVGMHGTYEKNVVLAIGRELARQINATPGMKAYMTRDSDVFIPLNLRARKARAAGADIFVSIHADAAENRAARGSSVYVLSLKGASSQRARWLADKENASDLIGGVPLQKVDTTLSSVLLDLAQSGHMRASEDAANHVLDGLKRVGNNHKPNIERANFAVLRTSDMPSMLVETAFISNPEEEKRLKDPAYQRKVASAVLDGVNTYFTRQPPPGTLFAARAQADAEARAAAAGGAAGAP